MLGTDCRGAELYNYTVSGNLRYQFFWQGKLIRTTTNDFEVIVKAGNTRIRATGLPNEGLPVRMREFITDGNTSCCIDEFDIAPEKVQEAQAGTNKIFSTFTTLYANPVPRNHSGLMGPVWLAMASSATFSVGNEAEIYPLVFMGTGWPEVGGKRLRASWSVSSAAPHLPEKLIEYADAETFELINRDFEKWQHKRLPQLYEAGYTNAIYEVLAWTNQGGLQVPVDFKLTRFFPKYDGQTVGDLETQVVYDGHLVSLVVGAAETILIPTRFPKWSRISEFRYGTVKDAPLVYTSETGTLLNAEDARLRIEALRRGVAVGDIVKGRRQRTVIAVLGVVTLVFVCVGLLVKSKISKTTNTSKP